MIPTGDWHFAADPRHGAWQQPVFWSPDVLGAVVPLAVSHDEASGHPQIRLCDFPDFVLRSALDRWHLMMRHDGVEHRAWFRTEPDRNVVYAPLLPFDDAFEARAHAATRLWRTLTGRPAGPDFRPLSAQKYARLLLSLQALDGHRHGADYRQVAIALFGLGRIADHPWKTSSVRDATIRLVRTGVQMMNGGYLDLLRFQ